MKGQTVSAAEAKALAAAERAKRANKGANKTEGSAPALSPEDLEQFRAWQAAKAEEQARKAIGTQAFMVEPGEVPGTLSYAIVGAMPNKPNDKGAFLNDNAKVTYQGRAYTLLVSLFPYNGKQSVARLQAMGEIVGAI